MGNATKVFASFLFVIGMLVLAANFYPIFDNKLEMAIIGLVVMIIGSLMYAGYRIRLTIFSVLIFIMVMVRINADVSGSNSGIIIGTMVLAPIIVLFVRKKK